MFIKQTLITTAATLAAAAGLAATTAPAASAATGYAHTPSGNITCKVTSGRSTSLTCSVRDARRTFKISASGTAFETRYQSIASRGQVFEYDEAYGLGSFTCLSSTEGLACMDDDTEEGFFLSREGSGLL